MGRIASEFLKRHFHVSVRHPHSFSFCIFFVFDVYTTIDCWILSAEYELHLSPVQATCNRQLKHTVLYAFFVCFNSIQSHISQYYHLGSSTFIAAITCCVRTFKRVRLIFHHFLVKKEKKTTTYRYVMRYILWDKISFPFLFRSVENKIFYINVIISFFDFVDHKYFFLFVYLNFLFPSNSKKKNDNNNDDNSINGHSKSQTHLVVYTRINFRFCLFDCMNLIWYEFPEDIHFICQKKSFSLKRICKKKE